MTLKHISDEHRNTILRNGSQLFNLKNDGIASGGKGLADFDTIGKARLYLPFDFLIVTNNSEDDIKIYFDGTTDNYKEVPKGVILTFENVHFTRILYENIGTSSITANKIEFTAQLRPLSDTLARSTGIPIIQMIKLIFSGD